MDLSSIDPKHFSKPEYRINEILTHILKNLGKDVAKNNILQENMAVLAKTDSELHDVFSKLNVAWVAYSFTRQDNELKMKMKDIWEDQLSLYRKVVESKISELIKLMDVKKMNDSTLEGLTNSLI